MSKENENSQLVFNDEHLKIRNNHPNIKIIQTGKATFDISYLNFEKEEIFIEIDDCLSTNTINRWIDDVAPIADVHEKEILSCIHYNDVSLFLTYYPETKRINISKTFVAELDDRILDYEFLDRGRILITIGQRSFILPFRKKSSLIKLGNNDGLLTPHDKVLIRINRRKFYLFVRRNTIYFSHDLHEVYHLRVKLNALFLFNKLIIFGKYLNVENSEFASYDHLYIRDTEASIGKFKRFNILGKFKSWGFASISVPDLMKSSEMNRSLTFGDEENSAYPLFMKREKKLLTVFALKKYKNKVMILRENIDGGASVTNVHYSQEYSLANKIRIFLASLCVRLLPNKKKMNVYFEKFTNKADESAIRVFEKVMLEENLNSINWFVLNKTSPFFSDLKQKYKSNLIAKYSFKHFYSVLRADHFISSELSNHIVGDRLFIPRLRRKIVKTPLIFLQHGIMFAKPIDNPMAKGFHKKHLLCNVQKSVISSHLEAEQFYKVGYEESDLLLTGLATFDHARLSPSADKIAYMPTYRYWEEHLVYNDEIEKTSYYKDLLQMIHLFEANNLLDRLLIVPHNKFANYFSEKFPNYRQYIHTNPSEALKEAKIFITDYSSAIYDAIFRGAYPIFYWEDKDYLIENYKAIPPVNDDNAPGPVAYSKDALIALVKKAIERDYQLEEEYVGKYRKINHFYDRKNTKRIVDFLINEKII